MYQTNQLNQTTQEIPYKSQIGPEEMKEIVQLLNSRFNENYNLYSFDEQNQFEFLELLNKIFQHLDSKWTIDIKVDNQETIIYKITEYLRILNYPSQFEEKWQQSVLQSDKKVIYPIFYYLLTRLGELEKRAYLAKFLVPVFIPDEFQMDNEIKVCLDQIKDLQAQFQVNHQQMESMQQQSMNPADLKREISQLEQEREQLISKIGQFKSKVSNKPNFAELLEVTNMLRREQEEEARLADKLRQQRAQLEWSDQQLMTAQQRLIDTQKSFGPDNSPEQMLLALRNEVKKNRELSRDRLGFDLKERRKKIEQTERLLSEPPITLNEINSLENTLMILRRNVNQMEDKLKREAKPEDDKLAIYKQQAQLITKKKELVLEDVKKYEEELQLIEKEVFKKEEQLQKKRGPQYKTKDEFKNYANQLKDKKSQYNRLKEEFKSLQGERGILERTESILQKQNQELMNKLQELEKIHGVVGFHGMAEGMEQSKLDKKGMSVEELTRLLAELQQKFNEKGPLVKELSKENKELGETFNKFESEYNHKKNQYDRAMLGIESDMNSLNNEVKKLRDEVYTYDKKIRLYKYNQGILEIKIQRLNDESDYLKGGSKKLSNQYQSNTEMLQARIVQLEENIKSLKAQRESVRDNYEPSLRQMNYFSDLKKILNVKLQSAQGDQAQQQGTKAGQNRLIIG